MSVVCVCHVVESAMSGVVSVTSGDVGWPFVGSRVCEFPFRMQKCDWAICSAMTSPLLSAMEECHSLS